MAERKNNAVKEKVIFSFFSGSGFLDLGFELNGFNINLVNEFQLCSSSKNVSKRSPKRLAPWST